MREEMSNVETLRELTAEELNSVAGGQPLVAQRDIRQDIHEGHINEAIFDVLMLRRRPLLINTGILPVMD